MLTRRLPRILVSAGFAGVIAAVTVTAQSAWAGVQTPANISAAAAPTTTVYLAPSSAGGSDKHTGLSSSSPVLTLARAQQVLEQKKPAGDVYVRIKQGTYVTGQTRWTFYVPGHTISFLPVNYTIGHGRPPGGDPVFLDSGRGSKHTAGWWFQAQTPSSKTAPLHDGGTAGLRFYYLSVQGYTNGISLDGQSGHTDHNSAKPPLYTKPSAGLNGNTVFGMTMINIGDKYASGQTGYGAILFTDSSSNRIANNTFSSIQNTGSSTGLIHGLYITHFSSSNTITGNHFSAISSYAVKVRDRSNYNAIEKNRFDGTGGVSAYRDEFCNLTCAQENPGTPRQCASYGNRFLDNTITNGFESSAHLATWSEDPSGNTYAGGSGCSIPKGQQRLTTGGNT